MGSLPLLRPVLNAMIHAILIHIPGWSTLYRNIVIFIFKSWTIYPCLTTWLLLTFSWFYLLSAYNFQFHIIIIIRLYSTEKKYFNFKYFCLNWSETTIILNYSLCNFVKNNFLFSNNECGIWAEVTKCQKILKENSEFFN